jgi:hypothetical protein
VRFVGESRQSYFLVGKMSNKNSNLDDDLLKLMSELNGSNTGSPPSKQV